MIYFILSAVLMIVIEVWLFVKYWENDKDIILMGTLSQLVVAIILFIVSTWLSSMTMGVMPNYSSGQREGYIIKVSEKGFIWKTIECEMQLGAGEQASLQEPFHFSIAKDNAKMIDYCKQNMGKKIRINYTEWLIMPFRIGESGYLAESVEISKAPQSETHPTPRSEE